MDIQPKNDNGEPIAQVSEDTGRPEAPVSRRIVKDHYEPENDRERRLDRRINTKFDLFVSAPLSFGFTLIASKSSTLYTRYSRSTVVHVGPCSPASPRGAASPWKAFIGMTSSSFSVPRLTKPLVDKSNIGYVATSNFIQDAHVTPNAVGLSLTLFSATYVPLHPLNTMLSFSQGPRNWIAGQLLSCGAVSALHATISGNGSLVALRLLLGAVEAGYNPCCIFLMSRFYPRKCLGARMGAFTCMFALACALAGIIAYGLLAVESRVIRGWQLVFLTEGIMTIVNSLVVFVMVPRSPEEAWFLTAEEKAHVAMRMRADSGAAAREEGEEPAREINVTGRVTLRDVTDVLGDWKKLLIIFWGICAITAMNAFPAFLPLLVEGMGYGGTQSNLMSVPPFAASIVLLMLFSSLSDRIGDRSAVIIGSFTTAAGAAVVMAAVENSSVRYAATHVCVPFVLIGGSLISVWLANNTRESVRVVAWRVNVEPVAVEGGS